MKKLFAMMAAVAAGLALTGCSHNPFMLLIGDKTAIGNLEYGEISRISGLYVLDVSRENSSWEMEINDEVGLQVDPKTGALKGVKKIRREIKKQISGNLVDLAKKDSKAAETWVKPEQPQVKAAKAKGQGNRNLNSVVPPAVDQAK